MREAYLVNNSQSIASIPLFEKVPATFRGRTIQKVQFKKMVPTEEYILGVDISPEKKKYYSQFRSILIDLKFRTVNPPQEVSNEDDKTEDPEIESPVQPEGKPEVSETKAEYTEDGLKKMRQAELLAIAAEMGIEMTTQNSKAEIIKAILEKVVE